MDKKRENEKMKVSCQLFLADCLEKLKEIPDNNIDLVLTDPPYGLEFMGKSWDKWQDSFNKKGCKRSAMIEAITEWTKKERGKK
jgi:DNA modification methylase